MSKLYLADSQDYLVAESFDQATEKFVEIRGKDPQTLALFKDTAFVINASEMFEATVGVLPELAETDGATVSPSVAYIPEGANVTLTATPSVGYPTFVEWQDGSANTLSTDNPFTYTMGTADIVINAVFSA